MLQAYAKNKSVYQKTVPLAPGTYRLNVVAKDVMGGNLNNYEVAINVPRMDTEKISSSSLILADVIEKVPARSIGTGPFVIGGSKVRPRVDDIFKRDEKMGIYMKLYNMGSDERHPQTDRRSVEYIVLKKRQQREDRRALPKTWRASGCLRQPGNNSEVLAFEYFEPRAVHHEAEDYG